MVEAAAEVIRVSRGAAVDAVASQVAVLDKDGVIVAVNAAWQRFGEENGIDPDHPSGVPGIGVNYLEVCAAGICSSNESARAAHDGIVDVLQGRLPSFRLYYDCHSPDQQRWFCMAVAPMCGKYEGVVVSHVDVTETWEQLRDSKEQLRALKTYQEHLLEQERKRIALELHDEMGQLLTALNLDVSTLGLRLGKEHALLGAVDEMQALTARAIEIVREVTSQLRPVALDLGLTPALEWLAASFSRRWQIPCRILGGENDLVLDDQVSTALFRVVQESLTNVARHARASAVRIHLAETGRDLRVVITDDGQGFDPASVGHQRSLGLLGMRERILALGGALSIDSSPGHGTTVNIGVPLRQGGRS